MALNYKFERNHFKFLAVILKNGTEEASILTIIYECVV